MVVRDPKSPSSLGLISPSDLDSASQKLNLFTLLLLAEFLKGQGRYGLDLAGVKLVVFFYSR
jgi:hypothetical protein